MPTSGTTAGVEIGLEESLKAYFRERKWDRETGFPAKEKLD